MTGINIEVKRCWKVLKKDRTSAIVDESPYKLCYPLGAIVKAPKNTMGVFCFEKEEYARAWAKKDALIIEVEGYGKPYRPRRVLALEDKRWFKRYKEINKKIWGIKAPKGTICFQKVKVLS